MSAFGAKWITEIRGHVRYDPMRASTVPAWPLGVQLLSFVVHVTSRNGNNRA